MNKIYLLEVLMQDFLKESRKPKKTNLMWNEQSKGANIAKMNRLRLLIKDTMFEIEKEMRGY